MMRPLTLKKMKIVDRHEIWRVRYPHNAILKLEYHMPKYNRLATMKRPYRGTLVQNHTRVQEFILV